MPPAGMLEFVSRWMRRVLAFALAYSLVLLLLYAAGNYQGFLDASQLLLLDMAGVSLWAACLSGSCVLVLLVVSAIHRRRLEPVRFLGTMLALAVSAALVAVLQFLTAWTRG